MRISSLLVSGLATCLLACGTEEPEPTPSAGSVHDFAGACVAIGVGEPGATPERWLAASAGGASYELTVEFSRASRFFAKPSDLATYLFYDADSQYLVGENGGLGRRAKLASDIQLLDDSYESEAEWQLARSRVDPDWFELRHLKTGALLANDVTLADDPARAAAIALYPASGCSEHPELSLDAHGTLDARRFSDGAVYGIVDSHSHLLTNFAFGGGGIFHGAPFHRLGVEHALGSCEPYHGFEGRNDLLGFGFDKGLAGDLDAGAVLPALLFGKLSEFYHHTDGYPEFTDWPNAPYSATHQTQYYRWLERAYLAGLRLVVQHATSNSVLCDLVVGQGIQQVRYGCGDMLAVDRIIEETYAMERYIDAHHGGPGRGWFRIVTTPEQARAVIDDGKLAVILGIETSNLFDCFLVPRPGYPTCDADHIAERVAHYYAKGVRAIFPVHKYDNAFSPGDGHRAISEIGGFANSGHWSSFTQDCPKDVTAVFDHGKLQFGGLNEPRDEYFAPPPVDMSKFAEKPVNTLLPFLDRLQEPSPDGEFCQSHGLTAHGEILIRLLMQRGMIIEIDHLPQWSYQRVFEILEEADYPAAATHGSQYHGKIYEIGGISKLNLGRCADPERPGSMLDGLRNRIELATSKGGYPAQGFGFDLNGFAGAPRPRFGERSECDTPQENPISYPFESVRGDVTFTEPKIGNRTLDFNTEGLVHVGLLPELIEDARRTGASAEDLEPLFRSAEGYLRMWERAEQRAKALY